MTNEERARLQLIDAIAAGDGQIWHDFWANADQRQIGETMYGAIADGILASSWLADLRADVFSDGYGESGYDADCNR